MKILIPTDFSTNAKHAIDYASLLAKSLSAEIGLFNVYTPAVTRNNLVYALIQDEIKGAVKGADEQLAKLCRGISEDSGILCKSKVTTGGAVDEIIKKAEDSKVDLIVMGTKGASGIEKILFGSNTASVIEGATCPVLVVPVNATIALPKKIVFATDFLDSDMQSLKELVTITKGLKVELFLLHVSKENLKSERDLIDDFSKAVADEVNIDQPHYYVMLHEDIRIGIDKFVDAIGVDLIALSMRKRGFFEKLFDSSLSKKMAYQARLPLLVLHATTTKSNDNDF